MLPATPVSPSLRRQHPNPAPVAASADGYYQRTQPFGEPVGCPELRCVPPKGLRSDPATGSPVPPKPCSADLSVLGPAFASPPPPLAETQPSEMQTWRVQRHVQKARAKRQAEESFRRLAARLAVRIRAAAITVPPGCKFPPCDADASPDAAPGAVAAAAPAPASTPVSPAVALLRREMADVKGQTQLMSVLEKIVKAEEKQNRRREAGGSAEQPDGAPSKTNRNMVFGGPPGTGKTSSVEKLANVLAAPEVGVLKHATVTVLNKTTQLSSSSKVTVPVAVKKMFEKANGGILFLDEVHKRTDSGSFVDALVTLLTEYEGKVMVVIAGYQKLVMEWLRTKDEGMLRRFPQQYRVDFLNLKWDVLVEIGQNRLKNYPGGPFTLLDDTATRGAFEDVMRYEANKSPPENAGGAINAVNAIVEEHNSRDGMDDDDCCITAADIHAACQQAAEAAATAATAPAAAPAFTAGGARCSSASGSQGSSSAAAAGPAVASDSEEDQPLDKRQCKAAAPAPAPAPSASSRKRKAESEEVGARDPSPEAKSLVKAIDAWYKLDEKASPIVAWDLLKVLHEQGCFENGSSVHEKMKQSKALGKTLKEWLTKGIDHISARGGESEKVWHKVTSKDNKLMIYGLCPKN